MPDYKVVKQAERCLMDHNIQVYIIFSTWGYRESQDYSQPPWVLRTPCTLLVHDYKFPYNIFKNVRNVQVSKSWGLILCITL